MARASWNSALLDELAAFASGPHDNQVDALSYALHTAARDVGSGGGVMVPRGSISAALARPPRLLQTQRRIARSNRP
jgi:hypothetical protein